MRNRLLLTVLFTALLVLTALPAAAGVGSVPLDPGEIEVMGSLTGRGALRLTLLMVPPSATQAAVHAVRLTALPSGTPLLALVAADAPAAVADRAFDTPAPALRGALTAGPMTLLVPPAPQGDNRVLVEYLTQLSTGEIQSAVIGTVQFPTLTDFHFSAAPGPTPDMLPRDCGYCGGVRCGCSSCDLVTCCPSCIVACAPWSC